MHTRTVTMTLGAAFLLACAQDTEPDAGPDLAGDTTAAVRADDRADVDLFADSASARDQIVFVGSDSTVRPRDHARSVFIPLSTFSVERDGIPNEFPSADSMETMLEAAGVGGDRVLIVGDPIPAGRAWAALDYLGLGERAALLDGGPAALATAPATGTAGGATAPAPGGTAATDLDADVRDDMIVDAAWVHDRLDDPGVAILDARPPAEFSGATPGDGIDRPGHIPGARNVFWQTLVESADNPRLRDEAQLRQIFEQAGVGPDDTIVAYCRTGGQASFLYTVARHLGYDVKLYDGSFIDWSRTDYPVER
ncbi:MAG TPA: rhodanese-like domain-containing protein [Longimicrobiales bacterium]|nr:rhodanese-like domain-containing protein [Longimicrobiales bacterium]